MLRPEWQGLAFPLPPIQQRSDHWQVWIRELKLSFRVSRHVDLEVKNVQAFSAVLSSLCSIGDGDSVVPNIGKGRGRLSSGGSIR